MEFVIFFKAEIGRRYAHYGREFRRVLFRSEALGVGDVGGEVGRPVVVDLDFAVQEERLVAVAGFVRRGGVEVVHAAAVGGRNDEVVVRATARYRFEGIDAEIGRSSCREGVCQSVYCWVVTAQLKKKT